MKHLRVAFYVYPTAFQSPGGGEVVLVKTKEYLEKEGLEVKLFDPWNDKLRDFDILHTFGSVKDALPMMETAHQLGVKNVLATICWYSWRSAWGTYPKLKDRIPSAIRYFAKSWFPWLPSERKRMMQISDLLLPNSQSEAEQLKRFFGVNDSKIQIIPNGVDGRFLKASPDEFVKTYGLRDFILVVGRIEPRKNQLNLVKALSGIDRPVVFIGEAVPRYQDYFAACRKAAGPNVHFLGPISHDSTLLASAYAACNTFVLATWLETPGLAALEAGLAGAKVVITSEGATREYFNDFALYTLPNRRDQIRSAVLASLKSPKSEALKKHIQSHYLWSEVAQKTLQAYQTLLPTN